MKEVITKVQWKTHQDVNGRPINVYRVRKYDESHPDFEKEKKLKKEFENKDSELKKI